MENNLQNKLYHYAALPPESAWDKIADALENNDYAKRLTAYEEQPPVTVWRKLEESLNEAATPAKVVPFLIRYKNPLRYVAAASVIAVALVAVTLTTRRTEAGSLAAGTNAVVTPPHTQPKFERRFVTNSPEGKSATKTADNAVEEKGLAASVRRTLAYIKPRNILPKLSLSKRFIPRQAVEKTVADFSTQDAFMVYSDGDGNAMRLPKKLFSLVNCEDGDETCKHRIETLRQKLSAAVAPSDFTGMLDLVRQLQ